MRFGLAFGLFFFFFSSRRRHTRYIGDWSSDVCSSDLDLRVRPDLKADLPQRATVFLCCTTGEKNSSAIDLLRQLGKDGAQAVGRSEPKIRGLQFSLLQDAKFPTGIIPTCRDYSCDQCPGGFRTAAFHSEDALTVFHDWLSLA